MAGLGIRLYTDEMIDAHTVRQQLGDAPLRRPLGITPLLSQALELYSRGLWIFHSASSV